MILGLTFVARDSGFHRVEKFAITSRAPAATDDAQSAARRSAVDAPHAAASIDCRAVVIFAVFSQFVAVLCTQLPPINGWRCACTSAALQARGEHWNRYSQPSAVGGIHRSARVDFYPNGVSAYAARFTARAFITATSAAFASRTARTSTG